MFDPWNFTEEVKKYKKKRAQLSADLGLVLLGPAAEDDVGVGGDGLTGGTDGLEGAGDVTRLRIY